MFFSRALKFHRIVLPAAAASGWSVAAPLRGVQCEGGSSDEAARLLHKRGTVSKAGAAQRRVRRTPTRDELSKLRADQEEMLRRWERDEDGWRELPARAWPAVQPNPDQLVGILVEVKKNGCDARQQSSDICQALLFNAATAMVFYNVDPVAGFRQYEALAENGHVDSMVACGVILTEGLGAIRNREQEGVNWLMKAVEMGSTQAMYELGTVYYTGIEGVVWEDPEGAYKLFEQAAGKGHVGATYMMADCLIEGEGTDVDIARAIPLLYQAADKGHRYARQRVRELLSMKSYQ